MKLIYFDSAFALTLIFFNRTRAHTFISSSLPLKHLVVLSRRIRNLCVLP